MKVPEKVTQSFLESFLSSEERRKREEQNSGSKISVATTVAATVSTTVQRVHCPTCGRSAERYHLLESARIRTQCAHCDYLMVACAKTGSVIEAYAPSFSPTMLAVT